MPNKTISGLNHALLRREAGEVLAKNANRLRLIEAIMICTTPLLLYLMLHNLCYLAIFPLWVWNGSALVTCLADLGYLAAVLILSQLFTLPLLFGLLHMARDMEGGEEAELSDVFYGFSSRRAYGMAQRFSWCVLWRAAVICFAEWAVYRLCFWLLDGSTLGALVGVAVTVPLAFLLLFLFCGGFFKPYRLLCRPAEAWRMCPYARPMGYRYWIGFVPSLVLSLLTVGILALADTLPKMLICYFRLSRKLNELTTQSED